MANVIWHFVDNKPGHENQSSGLVTALRAHSDVNVHVVKVADRQSLRSLLAWLSGRFDDGKRLGIPALHIGSGHATHVPMLAARKAYGGKAVVLMRPTLPLSWFDLCLIPEHDEPPQGDNIIATRGVLNRLRPSSSLDPRRGLILIGGPSKHFSWSDEQLTLQLREVVQDTNVERWTVATSRRTPEASCATLETLCSESVALVRSDSVDTDWLPSTLGQCGRIWVTEDSVSMVYEALTVGAATGLLKVPTRRSSRVSRGIRKLVDEGWVTPFDCWSKRRSLEPTGMLLDEADRCAVVIADRWF